jgi:hypothetical protein
MVCITELYRGESLSSKLKVRGKGAVIVNNYIRALRLLVASYRYQDSY